MLTSAAAHRSELVLRLRLEVGRVVALAYGLRNLELHGEVAQGTAEDSLEYVAALLDHQVLEPALTPVVTSPDELDALSSMRAQLRSISSTAAVCQRLDAAAELLELDQSPQPGGAAERYGALEAELASFHPETRSGVLMRLKHPD